MAKMTQESNFFEDSDRYVKPPGPSGRGLRGARRSRMDGVWNQGWQFVQVFGEDLKQFEIVRIQVDAEIPAF